jgi:hypothetical protein
MTESEEKEGKDFSEYARDRPSAAEPPPRDRPSPGKRSTFGIIVRGCGIAVGIAFLLLVFVVGACFIGMR